MKILLLIALILYYVHASDIARYVVVDKRVTPYDFGFPPLAGEVSVQLVRLKKLPCHKYKKESCAKRFLKLYDYIMSNNENLMERLKFRMAVKGKPARRLKLTKLIASYITTSLVRQAKRFDTSKMSFDTQRQILLIRTSKLVANKVYSRRVETLQSRLIEHYKNSRACPTKDWCLRKGDTRLEIYMYNIYEYHKLQRVWTSWYDATGPKLKKDFTVLVERLNLLARYNGFKDYGHYEWYSDTLTTRFDELLTRLYDEVKPFYLELHAYVRMEMYNIFPRLIDPKKPIPAHLFANPWAEGWRNIFDMVQPYKFRRTDYSQVLKDRFGNKLSSVEKMLRYVDGTFQGMGFKALKDHIYKSSIVNKPTDFDMDCHRTSFDFSNKKDYGMTACLNVTHDDFSIMHHMLAHTHIFNSYRNKPFSYRAPPSIAFYESLCDVMELVANSRDYLQRTKTIPNPKFMDEKYFMNYLMNAALETVPFIPFAYVMEKWRYGVFNGTIKPNEYNKYWWKYRREYQGLMPPTDRSDEKYADALGKLHIVANKPYYSIMVSTVQLFQIFEALCDVAGYKGELYECDFTKSEKANRLYKEAIESGRSLPWETVLYRLTGQSTVSAAAMMRFFAPLRAHLQAMNKYNRAPVGF